MIYQNQSTEKKQNLNQYNEYSPDDGSKENIDQQNYYNKNTVKKQQMSNCHRRYNSDYQNYQSDLVFSASQKPQINSDSKSFQTKFQSPLKVKKFQVEISENDSDFNENIFMQEDNQYQSTNWFIKDGNHDSFINDIKQQQLQNNNSQMSNSTYKTQNPNLNMSTNSSQNENTFQLECNEQFSQNASSQKKNNNNICDSNNNNNCKDDMDQNELIKQQKMFHEISDFTYNQNQKISNEQYNNPFLENIEDYQNCNFMEECNNNNKMGNEEQSEDESDDDDSSENQGFSQETLLYMMEKEMEYQADSTYLDTKQDNITSNMRSILVDWVMEVCMEFLMKRETFHIAVNIIDRYMSVKKNVEKKQFQLIGVTSMIIAAKQEEIYPPRLKDFLQSTDNGYSQQQVIQCETDILYNLKWQINPPTLNTWGNWYMVQWDLYISNSPFALNHPLNTNQQNMIQFKQPNETSYAIYREYMQIVDTVIMDYESLKYQPRSILASVMYLVLGKNYGLFTSQNIFMQFQNSSQFLISNQNMINSLFSDFLQFSFGFQLYELLQTIQYVASFFALPINIDLPRAAEINKKAVLEGHFEDFLAFQTHNSDSLQCVQERKQYYQSLLQQQQQQ